MSVHFLAVQRWPFKDVSGGFRIERKHLIVWDCNFGRTDIAVAVLACPFGGVRVKIEDSLNCTDDAYANLVNKLMSIY